jgi:arginyl-tRNA synthetase
MRRSSPAGTILRFAAVTENELDRKPALAALLEATIAKEFAVELPAAVIVGQLEVPKESRRGDLAFPAFTLAKSLKKPPPQLAAALAAAIAPHFAGTDFARAEAAGPYVNVFLDRTRRFAALVPAILDGSFLADRAKVGEKVMIEYSQPNTHKVFHVGHTRNVSLGDALVRLTRFAGHEVVAANYIGDVGTHIAKCLWYFTTRYRGEIPDVNRGAFLGRMYAAADALLDLATLTRAPHPGVVVAEVLSIADHPDPASQQLKIVEVDAGVAGRHVVVCGGSGYAVGDRVAYAKVGTRIGKRRIDVAERKGVASSGMICAEAEISLSGDAQRIAKLPPDAPLGVEIAEIFRIEGALPPGRPVLEEWQERGDGVRAMLRRLEDGDPEITALWRETRQWSLDEFDAIYRWLEAPFDHVFYESDVGDEGKRIVLEAFERGQLVKSEGVIGADLSDRKLPFFMLLKSDGTGLYSTKDLALAKRKFDQFGIDRSVYVVDASQSLHFDQVFATLEKLGYEQAKKCHHLAYGMVVLPDGKMSSRKGNVVPFTELEDQLVAYIRKQYLEDQRAELGDAVIEETARRVAIATIKYGMLNQDNNKNIVFALEEWTAPKGNTGPYLLYAYARTRSILRELKGYDLAAADWASLATDAESDLLAAMSRFPQVALDAARQYQPQLLCIYLYDLSRELSRFYENCPVLKAGSPELRAARGALVDAAGRVIGRGLELLGIKTVDRM